MAVLVLATVRARAAGVLYTRDPRNPKTGALWISAVWGLGLDVASGQVPADLFIVSRRSPHRILERRIVPKSEEVVPRPGGGLVRRPVEPRRAERPSLDDDEVARLARWALQIEQHFKAPQDVEWALDDEDQIWILQARPLAVAPKTTAPARAKVRGEPLLSGGRTVYPGRISGPTFLVEEPRRLNETPQGAIMFVRRASPEIVTVFPRIAGLVSEWGNVTGHAAALLREFKVPSVFEMTGAFTRLSPGDLVSLDAGKAKVYAGNLWPPAAGRAVIAERYVDRGRGPLGRRLLALTLVDPSAFRFRPSGCRSAHDVLRFCHEKAIEEMFALNDAALRRGAHHSSKLLTPAPVNLHVLDLGGGLALSRPGAPDVLPSEILCRPFLALWRGVMHPGVNWNREMPASFSGLASVMAASFSASHSARRALGEKSYLLITREYMNLNSRLAYHFTLVDACVSDVPGENYISFRFAGGGATRWRRNLRGCFLEACLAHYGFQVDRRGDVVNAWFKKAPAEDTEARLDILGRLMACASQLDMYMTGHDVMKWYVEQFLAGNYGFAVTQAGIAD
jgi:pyruvate,water dikinase